MSGAIVPEHSIRQHGYVQTVVVHCGARVVLGHCMPGTSHTSATRAASCVTDASCVVGLGRTSLIRSGRVGSDQVSVTEPDPENLKVSWSDPTRPDPG